MDLKDKLLSEERRPGGWMNELDADMGKIIKYMAIILIIGGVLAALIVGGVLIDTGTTLAEDAEWDGWDYTGHHVIYGIITMIAGSVGSCVVSALVYGFGIIVEYFGNKH